MIGIVTGIGIEIVVEEEAWLDRAPDCAAWAERAAEAALAEARSIAAFGPLPQDATVTVVLDADAEVAELNSRFLGKAGPTNVLSFPMWQGEALRELGDRDDLLGDIVLASGVCAREAADRGIAVIDHARHLIVHGTLHLLGHDHLAAGEARRMERAEARAMHRLRLPNPWKGAVAAASRGAA